MIDIGSNFCLGNKMLKIILFNFENVGLFVTIKRNFRECI